MEETIIEIPLLEEKTNYWFVRTDSGKYYRDFTMNEYIAIGWDKVSLKSMTSLSPEQIKKLIEADSYTEANELEEQTSTDRELTRGEKTRITTSYNKLDSFVNKMRVGDIVAVPSVNSDQITFGEITGNTYEDNDYASKFVEENKDSEIKPCPFSKRRPVKWGKTILKGNMDIYLKNALSTQHALSSLNEYRDLIDRNLYPQYILGEEFHTTVHATKDDGIKLSDLSDYLNILNQISKITGGENATIKMSINSPGLIEIIEALVEPTKAIASLFTSVGIGSAGIAFLISVIRNKGVDFKWKCGKEGFVKFEQGKDKSKIQEIDKNGKVVKVTEIDTSLLENFEEASKKIGARSDYNSQTEKLW